MRTFLKRCFGAAALALAAVSLVLAADDPAAPKSEAKAEAAKAPRNGSEVELVLLGRDKLIRVQVQIEIAGRPASRIWGETFDWLMARADRNDNGRLSADEVALLPTPFQLRQMLWGNVLPGVAPGPKLELLDTDSDGKVDRNELGEFYGQSGLGSVLVAVGQAPLSGALTDSLIKRLDVDGNQDVTEAEWKNAFETLRKLDANDDEVIGPGELLAKASYPGVIPALLVSAPTGMTRTVREGDIEGTRSSDKSSLLVLPRRRGNVFWTAELIRRRDTDGDGKLTVAESGLASQFEKLDADRDGKLTAEELAAWRSLPADGRWSVQFDAQGKPIGASKTASFLADAGSVQLDLRCEPGKLADEAASARRRILGQFSEADKDRNGLLAGDEFGPRNSELKALADREDKNGDKQLSEAELTGWLDFQGQVAAGHMLISVLDFGGGLFEFLDQDHNGALGGRELKSAWERVQKAGCVREGRFQRQALPTHLIGAISHGRGTAGTSGNRAGPAWFLSMDRNGDGEVSAREFLGAPADFRKMDLDSDGLVTPEEAAQVAAPPAKSDAPKSEPKSESKSN